MQLIYIFLQIILLYNVIATSQELSNECNIDGDCESWLACVDHKCKWCGKESTICYPNSSSLFQCCPGSKCIHIQNLNVSMCLRRSNKCESNADCANGLRCLVVKGECGVCKNENSLCSIPEGDMECCSGFCDLSHFSTHGSNIAIGLCKTPHLSECLTFRDCKHNFDCNNGFCDYCIRKGAPCRTNTDCCSTNCKSNVCVETPPPVIIKKPGCTSDANCTNGLKCNMVTHECSNCKSNNELCFINGQTIKSGDYECCSGFCSSQDFLHLMTNPQAKGYCRTPYFERCNTYLNCRDSFGCVEGRCNRCIRSGTFCRHPSDCCSGKCVESTLPYYKNRLMCED
jgi:hypothetical protein